MDVPKSTSALFEALLLYAARHSDDSEQLWVDPDDWKEPELDQSKATDVEDSSSDDDDDVPHLSSKKHVTPRFQHGPGVVELQYRPDGGEEMRVFVMHYVLPQKPGKKGHASCTMQLYRAACVAVPGRGRAEKSALAKFCKHALKWKKRLDETSPGVGKYTLYRCKTMRNDERVWWKNEGVRIARQLGTIYLPLSEKECLINDMQNFLASDTRKWYNEHGLPYRRSYLLYGPPGTGKSTTIRAAAGKFGLCVQQEFMLRSAMRCPRASSCAKQFLK